MMNRGITDNEIVEELQDFVNPSCAYDEIPPLLVGREGSPFTASYNLRFSHKQFEVIDVILEEPSLLKVSFHVPNPNNILTAFLYGADNQIVAMTETADMTESGVEFKEF